MAIKFATAFALTLMAGGAQANLNAAFIEGAPKDRFVFENAGDCAISDATIVLDLSTSPSGLIFDTTGAGAGVEVFQPFELVSGKDALKGVPQVTDGDTAIRLSVARLEPGASVAFTIDVDDTTSSRAITVNGSEIAGAQVVLDHGGKKAAAKFTKNASAILNSGGC
ncbi:MAG: aggregation factor core [Pseudomonadota bacterium]